MRTNIQESMFIKAAIFLLVLGAFWPSIGFGGSSQIFTGMGTALVLEDNHTHARQLAEKAALRKAVALAVESVIQKGTKEETHYNLKKQEILQGPYPFVQKQEVTGSELKGKLLEVVVRIAVDPDSLTRYLGQQGILAHRTEQRKRQDFPPVMVLVEEEIVGKVNRLPYSGRVVTDLLMQQGFQVLDEKAVQKSVSHDKAVQGILRGDATAAQAVALQYGAGILITGQAIVRKSSLQTTTMQVYGANVTLQALHADSGQIIASSAGDGSFPHIDLLTGSRKAVEEASHKAMKGLLADLQKNFESSKEAILVSVSGINFKQLAIVKAKLEREFETITSIQSKSFQSDVAKLIVAVDSSPEQFVEQVALKNFGAFRLEVVNFSPRKVDFVVRLNPAPTR